MELWIRSQDKYTLMKIEEIQICENPDGTWFMNAGIVLGKYKSEERALEVLDEIQSALDVFLNSDYLKNVTDVSKQVYIAPFIVYQMPKE